MDLWLLPTKMDVKDSSPHTDAVVPSETSPISVSLILHPGRTRYGDHSDALDPLSRRLICHPAKAFPVTHVPKTPTSQGEPSPPLAPAQLRAAIGSENFLADLTMVSQATWASFRNDRAWIVCMEQTSSAGWTQTRVHQVAMPELAQHSKRTAEFGEVWGLLHLCHRKGFILHSLPCVSPHQPISSMT